MGVTKKALKALGRASLEDIRYCLMDRWERGFDFCVFKLQEEVSTQRRRKFFFTAAWSCGDFRLEFYKAWLRGG